MVNKNFKMPVILIGNSFKYEIEATLKLFFHAERFSFSDNISDAVGDSYIIAGVENNRRIFSEVMLSGKKIHFQKLSIQRLNVIKNLLNMNCAGSYTEF